MRKIVLLVFFCGLPFWVSEGLSDEHLNYLQQQAATLFQPIPEKAAYLKGIPANAARLTLGKMLFFDPRLSSSHAISCNTCHNMGLGGADLQESSLGHGWQRGPRNAPTVFNSVFNATQFWDGRAKDLAEQAKGPVQRSIEMNNTPKTVIRTMMSIPQYTALFRKAFPTEGKPVIFDNVTKALEAFETSLLTPNAPIDRFIRGDSEAITKKEIEGLILFIDRSCASCHYGTNVGGKDFYVFGRLLDPSEGVRPSNDLGRFTFTDIVHDKYVFRAAPLRNVGLTAPYFHSGKVWRLTEAIKIMGHTQLGHTFTEKEAEVIAVFLRTLTGDQPRIVYPTLPPSSTETPKPGT